MLADENGVFRFLALETGTCAFSARKPAFETAGAEAVNIAGPVDNLKLKLKPLGVITGKVTDQEGNAVQRAEVVVIAPEVTDGLRHGRAVRTVSTDDRGEYRAWNLSSGKYYVKTAGRSGGTLLYAGDTDPPHLFQESFAPTYFGGGSRLAAAAPVTLAAGSEARADIRVSFQAASAISGVLESYAPRQGVRFELLRDGEDVAPGRVPVNGDTGRFEIPDVLPCAYLLRATQGENVAERAVVVSGAGLKGLTLALSPPVTIEVIDRSTNESPQEGGRCSVRLVEPTRAPGLPGAAIVRRESGRPAALRASPGTYRVTADCQGAYLRSAVSGTQDLLANPMLTVQAGVQPAIELVRTNGGGSVAATLEWQAGEPDSNPGVLLVPQLSASTGTVLRPATGEGKGGRFIAQFDSLAPGVYLAYAFSDVRDVEHRDPEFLKTLTGGVSVQVADQSEAKVVIAGVVR